MTTKQYIVSTPWGIHSIYIAAVDHKSVTAVQIILLKRLKENFPTITEHDVYNATPIDEIKLLK